MALWLWLVRCVTDPWCVSPQAKNKRLLSGNEALKASSWTERNVTGAASEEDAHLIRGMNEFLGVAEK